MTIVTKPLFDSELKKILAFISLDSKARARNFHRQLRKGFDTLDNYPYKFRKSIHFDDDNIRDYIFKGYTIPYLVDMDNDVIVVLDILKWVDK